MISYKASVAQKWFLFDLYDRQWSLTKPRSPKNGFYLISMIVNDLLQSLGRPKMVFIWSLWSSMISYKASVAQICVLFRLNDRQWSLTNPRSPNKCFYLVTMIINDLLQSLGRPKMFFIWSLWSSMISYKASVAQICVLFRFNDRQWSLTKHLSPKYVSYLDSMIVNDLLQSISRLNLSYFDLRIVNDLLKVSVAHIRFLFIFYDRQWSLTMPRSPKYVSYLDLMIINDFLQSLGRLNMCLI